MSDSTQALDWEARFQAGTAPWEREGLHPAFLSWRETGALAPSRILVPGAGRSREPEALTRAGFDVTVVDAAPSAVAYQRGRVRAAVEADLFAWSPEAPFESIYDQTCLCALPPPLLADYAAMLHRWLIPGGKLFVLFMQTGKAGGPPLDCPPDAMRGLFPDRVWGWPETLEPPIGHPSLYREIPCVLIRLA